MDASGLSPGCAFLGSMLVAIGALISGDMFLELTERKSISAVKLVGGLTLLFLAMRV